MSKSSIWYIREGEQEELLEKKKKLPAQPMSKSSIWYICEGEQEELKKKKKLPAQPMSNFLVHMRRRTRRTKEKEEEELQMGDRSRCQATLRFDLQTWARP